MEDINSSSSPKQSIEKEKQRIKTKYRNKKYVENDKENYKNYRAEKSLKIIKEERPIEEKPSVEKLDIEEEKTKFEKKITKNNGESMTIKLTNIKECNKPYIENNNMKNNSINNNNVNVSIQKDDKNNVIGGNDNFMRINKKNLMKSPKNKKKISNLIKNNSINNFFTMKDIDDINDKYSPNKKINNIKNNYNYTINNKIIKNKIKIMN